jgi:hypothetical protein
MIDKRSLLVAALLLIVALPAQADDIKPLVSEHSGYTMVKVELPGPLIGVAEQMDVSGTRHLLLLSGEHSAPETALRLFRFDPSGESPLEEIRHDIPPDTRTLFALDLNGDGTARPVIGRPGGLYALPVDGTAELIIESAGFLPRIAEHWRSGTGPAMVHHLTVAGVGFLHDYRFKPGATAFTLARDERLPMAVTRRHDGLYLRTPQPVQLSAGPDAPPLFAIGPVPRGKQRLLTLLVDLADPSEEATVIENWSRLPQPEDLSQRWFRLINGKPALVVTTVFSEQKGALEKKKLRVFMLGADRTRGGADAILEIQTPSRQWFDASVTVADINQDGLDDLVVVMPEGLGGGKLLLEGYLGHAAGGFSAKPRRTMLKRTVEDWHFGGDVNGDGIGDLVVIEDDGLSAFAGIADSRSSGLVQEEHLWRVDFGDTETTVEVVIGATSGDVVVNNDVNGLGGRLQVRDLVDDSRAEVMIMTSASENGRGTVILILPL